MRFRALLLAIPALVCLADPTDAFASGAGRLRMGRPGIPPPPPPPPYTTNIVNGTGWPVTNCPAAGGTATCDYPSSGDSSTPEYPLYAILAWDAVPYQDLTGDFSITVVAGHTPTDVEFAAGTTNNISRVEISCNGGTPAVITSQTVNPTTGITGFVGTIKTSTFADGGPYDCRATAFPTTGKPRTLQGAVPNGNSTTGTDFTNIYSFWFNANSGGTLSSPVRFVSTAGTDVGGCGVSRGASACLTVRQAITEIIAANAGLGTNIVGGGTVKMQAGMSYVYPTNSGSSWEAALNKTRWLNIQADDGLTRDQVGFQVVGASPTSGGLKTSRVHIKSVTLYHPEAPLGTASYFGFLSGTTSGQSWLWMDDIVATGWNARWNVGGIPAIAWNFGSGNSAWAMKFITDTTLNNFAYGPTSAALVRNVTVTVNGGDIISDSATVLNLTVTSAGGTYHVNGGMTKVLAQVYAGQTYMDVDNLDDMAVGKTSVAPTCGLLGNLNAPRSITSIDSSVVAPLYRVFVSGAAATGNCVNTNLVSGSHSDVYQFNNSGIQDNRVIVGVTATTQIEAQCLFTDANPRTIRNIWFKDFSCNNQSWGSYGAGNYYWGKSTTNAFIQNYNFGGPPSGSALTTLGGTPGKFTDWVWQSTLPTNKCVTITGFSYAPYGMRFQATPASPCQLAP